MQKNCTLAGKVVMGSIQRAASMCPGRARSPQEQFSQWEAGSFPAPANPQGVTQQGLGG